MFSHVFSWVQLLMLRFNMLSGALTLSQINTRDNLEHTSYFYCILNCLGLKFSLFLCVLLSQRAVCHSQDPLLQVFSGYK